MKSFTRLEGQPLGRNQRGINMVGLIIWSFLAVIVMGAVVALFTTASEQTAIGAEQNQQQQSVLNALNRVSRDVSMSNPIVYASEEDLVLDVTMEDSSVERRRYYLDTNAKKVWEYSKKIQRGDSYDPANSTYWSTDIQRSATTVYGVDAGTGTPFLSYYDSGSTKITEAVTTSANAEAIARVDISLTADVANKGKVSLSTSAVPRSTTNLGATATPILAPCPAFTATLNDNTVVLRWDKASDEATSYEVTRNGVTIQPTTLVTDQNKLKYSFTDTPGASSTVLNYMLKVVSPAGISNCIDSVRAIVIAPGATQLGATLLPATNTDGSGVPTSTNWTSATETTKVRLDWQKVDIATGYVIYKQRLDNAGVPVGSRVTVATLEEYPYVEKDDGTPAPNNLTYDADAGWDEHWEWSIKVLSRSGDNEETPEMRTLSYPAPVTDASVSALPLSGVGRVSDADVQAGKGNNRITWTYTAGMEARGFDIYRSAIDQPATNFPAGFTKIGNVNAGINEFFDRNAEFGSTYGYYVVAKNKSGFANSYASKRVQQLQFPPDPVITPVGVNGSRDLNDGTNRVRWTAAKSATGYHIERVDMQGQNRVCLSGANCSANSGGAAATATSFDDNSSVVDPATRLRYVAFAYNATGLSPKLAAAVTLTQRPANPVSSVTNAPDNGITTAALQTTLGWTTTAGSWCVDGDYTGASGSTACEYETSQFNNNGTLKDRRSGFVSSLLYGNQGWGRHYTYHVRARNAAIYNGGWSGNSNTVSANTYPSPFNVNLWNGDSTGANKQRINYVSKVEVGGWGDVSKTGYTTASWGAGTGMKSISVVRNADGWQTTSTNADLLLPSVARAYGSINDDGAGNVDSGTWTYIAAPGTRYDYDFTATSLENTLTRTVGTGYTYTPTDVPQAGAVAIVCAGPGNGDTTGTQDHAGQLIAARTAYPNFDARYGYYSNTSVEKLYNSKTNGVVSGIKSNGFVNVAPGASGDNIRTHNGLSYFRGIANGFNFTNEAAGRTDSATLTHFLVHVYYTFDNCVGTGQTMQEPTDACYGTAYSGCMTLNASDRPRWLSQ